MKKMRRALVLAAGVIAIAAIVVLVVKAVRLGLSGEVLRSALYVAAAVGIDLAAMALLTHEAKSGTGKPGGDDEPEPAASAKSPMEASSSGNCHKVVADWYDKYWSDPVGRVYLDSINRVLHLDRCRHDNDPGLARIIDKTSGDPRRVWIDLVWGRCLDLDGKEEARVTRELKDALGRYAAPYLPWA